MQKIYSDFELQGVMEEKLNSREYQTVYQRMQTEEAAFSLINSVSVSGSNNTDAASNGGPSTSSAKPEGDNSQEENIISNVVGKVGNIFGKGIGGLSTKLGGNSANWF